jgi:hypothetical protein
VVASELQVVDFDDAAASMTDLRCLDFQNS